MAPCSIRALYLLVTGIYQKHPPNTCRLQVKTKTLPLIIPTSSLPFCSPQVVSLPLPLP